MFFDFFLVFFFLRIENAYFIMKIIKIPEFKLIKNELKIYNKTFYKPQKPVIERKIRNTRINFEGNYRAIMTSFLSTLCIHRVFKMLFSFVERDA